MSAKVTTLPDVVIKKFCETCNWAYEAWVTHRGLFDDNTQTEALRRSRSAEALARLSIITQEYCLLQIAKLHDPAGQNGQLNLSLRYIIEYGAWGQETATELERLFGEMDSFVNDLRAPRNKVLSHNDLPAILKNESLGAFEKNRDVTYFECLQNFVNIIHEKYIGVPFTFNDLAKADALLLANVLAKDKAK